MNLIFFLILAQASGAVAAEAAAPATFVITEGMVQTVAALLSTCITAVIGYFIARLNSTTKAVVAATEVIAEKAQIAEDDRAVVKQTLEETASKARVDRDLVKKTLEASIHKTDVKLDQIHILVNSDRGKLLKLCAVTLRRVADQSGKEEDHQAASMAEDSYREHEKQQAIVDARVERRRPHK